MAHWTASAMDLPEESEPPSCYRPSPGGPIEASPGTGGWVPRRTDDAQPWEFNTPLQHQRTRGWLQFVNCPYEPTLDNWQDDA